MAPSSELRRPKVDLIKSADTCREILNRLKEHASDRKSVYTSGKKHIILQDVITRTSTNILSLKAWTAAIGKGRQTSDEEIKASIDAVFGIIVSSIADAREALDHRLRLGPLTSEKTRSADQERLTKALNEITGTIGYLHNQVKTVLRDTPDQRKRQDRVSEIVQRRPKLHYVFNRTIEQMTEAERRSIRLGTCRPLWESFPPGLDLEGNVGNFFDPGDGKVYNETSIRMVKHILKAFYDAWQEATINAGEATPMSPNTLRKMGKLREMARICLILRGMKQERLLDCFCEDSRDDRHLPLESEVLRSMFDRDDQNLAETFCTEQFRALPRTWNEGTHIKVADAEPLPLMFVNGYGNGSYGIVTRVKDVFTGVVYACKEQISSEARLHLLREIARLKQLRHRHIVQFVKSYQRHDRYGILLKPAATTDLKKLLDRYRRNGLDYDRDARDRRRDRVVLKPVLLNAFGCLSRGLAHIHSCNICHKDIKPANILFEKAKDPNPARFLWADFGLAHDFGDTGNSKAVSKYRYRPSLRYAAPEIMEEYRAHEARGEVIYDDTDDEEEDAHVHAPDQPNGGQGKSIGHGRSSDIFSFGIVFLELLSYLIAEGPEASIPSDFEDCMPFWMNVKSLQDWAHKQIQRLPPEDPLVFLFRISSKMIAHKATDRPVISDVVRDLTSANSQYLCTACLQDPEEPISKTVVAEEQTIEGLEKANLLLQNVGSHEYKSVTRVDEVDEVDNAQETPIEHPEFVQRRHVSWNSQPVLSDQSLGSQESLATLARAGERAPKDNVDEALPDAEDERDDDLASLASSISFTDSGYESLNDNAELNDGADELTSMLLDDIRLQELFAVAFRRAKPQEKFIGKFRMLLKIFGSELRKEAKNSSHEAAAGLAQTKARYVANEVQKWYMSKDEHREKSNDARSARVELLLLNRHEPSSPILHASFPDQYDYASDSDHSVDNDSDAEILAEHEEKSHVSLRELKEFIVSSSAFNHLQNAFRRMVYPDPFKAISNIISDAYDLEQGTTTAVFNVRWEIAQYLNSELGYHPALLQRSDSLGSVLTITGTVSKPYAAKAAEYMHWKWPRSDLKLLETIENVLKGRTTETEERSNLKIKLHNSDGSAGTTVCSISINGLLHELVEIAQQLAWITASFRVPQYGQLSNSEVVLEKTGDMIFNIRLLELEAVRHRASACWLPLFENGIIARGFSVPARNNEKGIEVPFSVMTGLANIMYPVFYADGVYLRGFSKLLFPTAVSPDMESVQWHLMSSPNPRLRIPPGTLPNEDIECKWLKLTDFDRLASAARTFLGYCRAINVHLGTESSKEDYNTVTYSGADDEHPAPGVAPKSMTTGTSGLGIWGFSVNMDILLPKGLLANTEPGGYLHQVDLAKETPVILYDNAKASKRAWLVPTLSVVLHMAHIWARDKDDLLTTLPFANLDGDSGQAASIAIKKHSRDELRDELKGDEKYRLSDLIGRLLISLDKLADAEAHAKSEPGRSINLESSKLYGWDLLAIAKGQRIMIRKQVDLSQNWTILGADILVLFCQNLGDIIRPASDVRVCPWGDLSRHGQNYLTATVQCLQTLSEWRTGVIDKNCLRLADQAYWPYPGDDQFEDCTRCLDSSHERRIKCLKRPQQILSRETSCRKTGTLPARGAVSFGTWKLRKRIPSVVQKRFQLALTVPETQLVDEGSQADDRPLHASDLSEIELENTTSDEASASPPERTLNSSATSETQDARRDAGDEIVPSAHDSQEEPPSLPSIQDVRDVVDENKHLQVTRIKANKSRRLNWKLPRLRKH